MKQEKDMFKIIWHKRYSILSHIKTKNNITKKQKKNTKIALYQKIQLRTKV